MTNLPDLSPVWQSICPTMSALGRKAIQDALVLDGSEVLPPAPLIFRAFDEVPPDRCRVVILGLDPYPTPGHAMGLSFSVPNGRPRARTFNNIAKEYAADLGFPLATSDLTQWAERGVLLANVALTVRSGKAKSHIKLWEKFAASWIAALANHDSSRVWLLWGNDAQKFLPIINAGSAPHRVIATSHPSPLAARHSFFGSKPFSRVNGELASLGHPPINWKLDSQSSLF